MPIQEPPRRDVPGRADPLQLEGALRAVQRTVPQRIAGRVTELTGLVLRATAPGARAGELVEIERLHDPNDSGGVVQGMSGEGALHGPLFAEVASELPTYRMLIFGLALVVMMVVRPRGLVSSREPTASLGQRRAIDSTLVSQGHG